MQVRPLQASISKLGFPAKANGVVYRGQMDIQDIRHTEKRWKDPITVIGQKLVEQIRERFKNMFCRAAFRGKGAHTLIEAIIRLHKIGSKLHTTIAGEPYDKSYKESMMRILANERLKI